MIPRYLTLTSASPDDRKPHVCYWVGSQLARQFQTEVRISLDREASCPAATEYLPAANHHVAAETMQLYTPASCKLRPHL